MNTQWHLPSTRPCYTRIEIFLGPGGAVEIRHFAGDGPGHATKAETTAYDLLTEREAQDVVEALLDGLRLWG